MSTARRKPRVFISRTTAGLATLAERVAEVLRQRVIEPIIQTGFYPSTHDVKGMLADHLQQCDAVLCLIGTAYGSGPHDPITKAEQPVHGLKDSRTKDRPFSYTQLELLIARDLGRPIYTFFIEGDELPAAFASEPPELAQRQQTFITEFAKDGRNTYGTFSQWDQPSDPARGLKQTIEAIKFEITVLAGKPTNLPYTSLGTLFKGRDEFLAELRQHFTAEGPVVIKGKRTIHGMGGVGKTRAAIEYAWKHADDYRALLFISADTSEALHRNLAALCGPLVLNLPEQNEKEQALQVEASLRWLKLHPGWFLIIDNVDTDEAAEETRSLLAKLTTGHVLITSRISDWTGHVKSLDLDVLSEAASIAFLEERTEERRPKREDDREKVAALVQLLDCLALALEQAGAHISTSVISYADYIVLWESHRSDALAWHDEDKMKYPKSVAITYETSISQLSDGAKELFETLSWFAPDPIPRRSLDSRRNPSEEKRHLEEIERRHLARYVLDGRSFKIHRLVQEISRGKQSAACDEGPLAHMQKPFCDSTQTSLDVYLKNPPGHLLQALFWLNSEIQADLNDPGNWQTHAPLVAHAQLASNAAAEYPICHPTARLLASCGCYWHARGEFALAEPLFRQALALAEISFGPRHEFVAAYISSFASLLHDSGRLLEAEVLRRRSLIITEATLGHDHPNVAIELNNLAVLLKETNRLAAGEEFARRALQIDEAVYGVDHPKVAIRLNTLAGILQEMGQIKDAEPLMWRALSIFEKEGGIEGKAVGTQLNNIALLLQHTGRDSDAEPLLRRALDIDVALYGPNHFNVAFVMDNLARSLQRLDRINEAEFLMRKALAICEETYGQAHPKTATTLSNMATLCFVAGRLGEAAIFARRAVEVFRDHALQSHVESVGAEQALLNLRTFLLAQGMPFNQVEKTIADILRKS